MNIGDPAYWDVRYKNELENRQGSYDLFDFYCRFTDLYPMVKAFFDPTVLHKILIIGVGRSNVVEHLYRQGFRDITAIDISETIITEMQRRYESLSGVEFFVMDVKQLFKFADNTFSIVFDKACIDALFCGTDYLETSGQAFREIQRVLQPEGLFLMVTHAPPIARVPYLRLVTWALEMYKVPSNIGESLSLYVITKTENPVMLAKRIVGGEAGMRKKTTRIVSDSDGKGPKGSTTRSGRNTGMITVTGSIDSLAGMVAESADVDS